MKYSLLLLLTIIVNSNYFDYGSYLIPHPQKIQKGGEDAMYTSSHLLIVADGVGSWAEQGVDAGIFSRQLTKNAYTAWKLNSQYYASRPRQLMMKSVENNKKQGSSTMTIMTVDYLGRVYSANLGDSGYKIFRRHPLSHQFQVVYESVEQQHSFNVPYQLVSPSSKLAQGDSPNNSSVVYHYLKNNDIILLATDGLFDNLYLKDILKILTSFGKFNQFGEMLNKDFVAQTLAQTGIKYGKDINRKSPYQQQALKNGQNFTGGKLDDTTIILAQLVLNRNNQPIPPLTNIGQFSKNRQ